MSDGFGSYVRERREAVDDDDVRLSVRGLARRLGVQASYLSKVERDEVPPPSEALIVRIAHELDEDPDMLLALGGKVSSELQAVIRKRPRLFAELIRSLKDQPDHAVLRVVREVRDGNLRRQT